MFALRKLFWKSLFFAKFKNLSALIFVQISDKRINYKISRGNLVITLASECRNSGKYRSESFSTLERMLLETLVSRSTSNTSKDLFSVNFNQFFFLIVSCIKRWFIHTRMITNVSLFWATLSLHRLKRISRSTIETAVTNDRSYITT